MHHVSRGLSHLSHLPALVRHHHVTFFTRATRLIRGCSVHPLTGRRTCLPCVMPTSCVAIVSQEEWRKEVKEENKNLQEAWKRKVEEESKHRNDSSDAWISLPQWLLDIGKDNQDIFFTDRERWRNTECLSWGINKERVLKGKTRIEHMLDNVRWDTSGRFIERSTAYEPWIWSTGNHELDYAPEIVVALTEDLVRIFVGIEDVNDLIVDLANALRTGPL
ncbi:hypothetical protein JHK87_006501 [Glycine soja]|nr:hypothetical protein JHK87_006501 [Glycine soja]